MTSRTRALALSFGLVVPPVVAALGLALLLPPDLASAQGYAADEAAKKMTVADGFAVKLVAAAPLVRKPVAVEFDDRGRLWVIQISCPT